MERSFITSGPDQASVRGPCTFIPYFLEFSVSILFGYFDHFHFSVATFAGPQTFFNANNAAVAMLIVSERKIRTQLVKGACLRSLSA